MNETTKERKDRLNEMHKAWIEVTSSALSELHKTDGYKGDSDDYRAVASIQEYSLSAAERLDK
ncbi:MULTISPECIES: hypothetical protein [unclassified Neptuniibacter]|uniref:hypothetical protein n=1 Tax=unclassified Neptuniibacter TaxID=2630693 RepID=UPI000C41D9A6|nr:MULTISPECIES: hypothetical protein [unclassified Neptuniibacter]MAY43571.1 hypothetical protein [Oceanospirillaceae bacterium]|tara:strand:- start:28036 stop:28224 length:189 start_codon:yes stop_codon:yes gene_type:complete